MLVIFFSIGVYYEKDIYNIVYFADDVSIIVSI